MGFLDVLATIGEIASEIIDALDGDDRY